MPAIKCIPSGKAAKYIGVGASTLAVWRSRGIGPNWYHLEKGEGNNRHSGVIVYSVREIDAWLIGWHQLATRAYPQPRPGNQSGVKFPNRKPRRADAKKPGRKPKIKATEAPEGS